MRQKHVKVSALLVIAVGTIQDDTLSQLLPIRDQNLKRYLRRWRQENLIRVTRHSRPVYRLTFQGKKYINRCPRQVCHQAIKQLLE